ncbi:hypothetical protein Bca4012_095565 [Brassica carinata]
MALSKVQLVVPLMACFLLFTAQSEAYTINECNFRGKCNTAADCKVPCEDSEFPPGTIGKCVKDLLGSGYLCCCTLIDK